MTTTGSGPQNLPVSPGMNIKGTKATMLVKILKTTGEATSLCAVDRSDLVVLLRLPLFVNVLADDDCIVDHDPQNDQETEQGNHVDADSRQWQKQQSTDERDHHAGIITQNARRNSRKKRQDHQHNGTTARTAFLIEPEFNRRRNSSALFLSMRHLTPGGNTVSNSRMVCSTALAMSIGDCDPTR